jgi:hypothetical protein
VQIPVWQTLITHQFCSELQKLTTYKTLPYPRFEPGSPGPLGIKSAMLTLEPMRSARLSRSWRAEILHEYALLVQS